MCVYVCGCVWCRKGIRTTILGRTEKERDAGHWGYTIEGKRGTGGLHLNRVCVVRPIISWRLSAHLTAHSTRPNKFQASIKGCEGRRREAGGGSGGGELCRRLACCLCLGSAEGPPNRNLIQFQNGVCISSTCTWLPIRTAINRKRSTAPHRIASDHIVATPIHNFIISCASPRLPSGTSPRAGKCGRVKPHSEE